MGQFAALVLLGLLVSTRPGQAQTRHEPRLREAIVSMPAESLRTRADSNPDTPIEESIVGADVAAIRTVRLVAVPDSIVLIIGKPVILFSLYRLEAYDATGHAISGLVPYVETEDKSLFRRDGYHTIGIKEGMTRLRITPMVFHPEYRGSPAEAFVRVYVRAR